MAHIAEWRVRETSTTVGTIDLVLDGAMRGSLSFASVMATGDTCDYVIHYDTAFEAGLGTMAADGKLQRTTVYRSRHTNGVVDQNKVSLPAGTKTVIMSARASKIARVDRSQSFDAAERAQHRANVPPFESGTRLIFQQTTPPVGWTKDTSHNDKSLRIVSGSVGSGGSVNFSTLFGRTATDGQTLQQGNIPSYNLDVSALTVEKNGPVPLWENSASTHDGTGSLIPSLVQTSSSAIFDVGGTLHSGGSGQSFTMPIDMRVKYIDTILAQKD